MRQLVVGRGGEGEVDWAGGTSLAVGGDSLPFLDGEVGRVAQIRHHIHTDPFLLSLAYLLTHESIHIDEVRLVDRRMAVHQQALILHPLIRYLESLLLRAVWQAVLLYGQRSLALLQWHTRYVALFPLC